MQDVFVGDGGLPFKSQAMPQFIDISARHASRASTADDESHAAKRLIANTDFLEVPFDEGEIKQCPNSVTFLQGMRAPCQHRR